MEVVPYRQEERAVPGLQQVLAVPGYQQMEEAVRGYLQRVEAVRRSHDRLHHGMQRRDLRRRLDRARGRVWLTLPRL